MERQENAKSVAESEEEQIDKYKVKEAKEIIQSNIRFEKDKLAEECLSNSAAMNIPCKCPEGKQLERIQWTQKISTPPAMDSSGMKNIQTFLIT